MKTELITAFRYMAIICVLVCTISCDKRDSTATAVQTTVASAVRSNSAELATLPADMLRSAVVKDDGQPAIEAYIHKNGSGAVFTIKSQEGVRLIHKAGTTPPYPVVDFVTISPDGLRVAYVISENGKVRLVLDGVLGPYFDLISSPLFTSDSRHIIYKAKIGETWHLVIDGKPSATGKYLIDGEPLLADNGASVIVVEKQDEKSAFEIVEYSLAHQRKVLVTIAAKSIIFAPTTKRFAAIISADNKYQLVFRELYADKILATGKAWDEITQVNFDAAGDHIAYVAREGKQRFIVLDNRIEPLPNGEIIELPVINAADGTASVIMYNKLVSRYVAFSTRKQERIKYEEINELQFSPDGKREFFVGKEKGKYFLVVNGAKGPNFDKIVTPRMSPNGKIIVYRVRQEGKRFLVIADGEGKTIRTLSTFDMVFEPKFTTDDLFVAYGVKDGNKLLWKVEKL